MSPSFRIAEHSNRLLKVGCLQPTMIGRMESLSTRTCLYRRESLGFNADVEE